MFKTRRSGSDGRTRRGRGVVRAAVAEAMEPRVLLATIEFAAMQEFAVGAQPYCVAIGDLNGDQKADLVTSNPGASSVSVLLGNGNGTFQAQKSFGTGTSPDDVVVADLNKDGKSDLVVNKPGDNSVGVLLGNGDGTFREPVTYGMGKWPGSVAVGDLNHDGNLDIVTANQNDKSVSVRLGNGDGTFQSQSVHGGGKNSSVVGITEVEGDNNPDILTVHKPDLMDFNHGVSLAEFKGNGDGSFSYNGGVGEVGADTFYAPVFMIGGDLNADGKSDWVVITDIDLRVLLNKGDGTYAVGHTVKSGYGTDFYTVAIGDLNNDGKLDLAWIARSEFGDDYVALATGVGDGTFNEYTRGPTLTKGSGACYLASGDVNGDGKTDLVIANASSNTVGVLVNTTGPVGPDVTAPTPDPSTFAAGPTWTGTGIRMVATTASDPSGVQYFFSCTAGGGHDSGWQDSTEYVDAVSAPGQYTYRVQTRDKSASQNTGGWSASASATVTVTKPTFTITNPTGWTYVTGQDVLIQWTAGNVLAGSTISLCYDADAIPMNGNEKWIEIGQVAAGEGSGAYVWKTAGVAAGTYYLSGYMYHPLASTFTSAAPKVVVAAQPTFTITNPTGWTYVTGQDVLIQWTAGNVLAGSTISLCYDADAICSNGNEKWIEIGQVAAGNGSGSYVWKTAGVAAGTYYLNGYMHNLLASSFTSAAPKVVVAAQPRFAITNTAGMYVRGQDVTIQWTVGDVLAGSTISLCYDVDAICSNGNEKWIEIGQVAAGNGSGSYVWKTAGVAAGTYYLNGYMYNSLASTFTSAAPKVVITAMVVTPTFTITNPSGWTYVTGQDVLIQWSAGNVLAGSTISLCYDVDAICSNGNEKWIEVGQVTAGEGIGAYVWKTAGVAAGTYYLSGYMYHPLASSFATQAPKVVVAAQPTFAITNTAGTYNTAQDVAIQWTAGNVLAGSTISLCYDADAIPMNGNEKWIEVGKVAAGEGAGTYVWDLSGVSAGTYYLNGYMYHPVTSTFSSQAAQITVQSGPSFTITNPSGWTYVVGQDVLIQWTSGNIFAGSTISLCYDADTICSNGNETWIEVGQVAAGNGSGSYVWKTGGVKAGTYYLNGYMGSSRGTVNSAAAPQVVIAAQPTFAIDPPKQQTYIVGSTIAINWTAGNVLAGSTLSLVVDHDGTYNSGDEVWLTTGSIVVGNGAGTYSWNTLGYLTGTYKVGGYIHHPITDTYNSVWQTVQLLPRFPW